jgi:PAS domain S-box-containing protein
MLDHELKIRRFTPVTQRVFNLIPTDIGRPFGDIKPKVHLPHLERLVAHVIDTVTVHEQEVVDSDGRYYHLSIRPYRTPENKIDGAVLVFVDIDTVKRASLHLEESKNYAEAIVEAVLDPLLVLDADFMIQRANSAYYRLFRTDAPHTENRSLFALDKSQWDLPAIRRLLRATFQRRRMPPVEVTETFPRIGERTLLVTSRPLARRNGQRPLILLTMADITARRRAEDERENLRRQFEQERILFEAVLRQLGVGVAIFGAPNGRLILANEGLHKVLKRRLPASAHVSLFRKIRATHALDGGRPALGWPMERTLAKGESVLYQEVTLNRPRVSERTALQVSSSPVYDAANRMIAVVALFQDITERKRTKEQLIEVSAREQRRISHDLHDGLGQELAAVGYRIKALQARLARTHSAEADEAGKIGALAEIVLGHTRDLVRFVQPVALDARGLMRSLKDLALSSSRSFRVACTFSCPRPVTLASQDLANNVFRIAQEAVHNAIRHGKPRHIAISLARRSRGLVELSVINDGANFHLPGRLQKRGLGLHIMSYRANLMGGELTVKKHAPRGTVVKCLFPAKATL